MAAMLDNRSLVTAATTHGGITFDQLCRGKQAYYVCDKECLVHDITHTDTLQQVEDKLVRKIEELFTEIEIQRDAKIKKFYIGKTYVQKVKRSKTVDPVNPTSWRKAGISSRWGDHRKEDYGKDGMIVIAILTKDEVPRQEDGRVVGQELYTLALEQRLLHYYKITRNDARFDNDTFTSGGADKKGSAGYALYVAFSLEENEDNDYEQNVFREEESILPDEYPQVDHTTHESTDTSLVQSETNPQQVDLNTVSDSTAMLVNDGCSLEEEQSRQYTSPSQYYDETIFHSPQTINQSPQHETILHSQTYPTEIRSPSRAEICSPSRAEIRSPSRAEIRSPSRAEIRSPSRAEIRSPSRAEIRTPSRAEIRTPSRASIRTRSRASIRTTNVTEIQNVPGNDGSGQSHSRNDNISLRFAKCRQISSENEDADIIVTGVSHSLTNRNSTKHTKSNNGSLPVRKKLRLSLQTNRGKKQKHFWKEAEDKSQTIRRLFSEDLHSTTLQTR